jgi:phosphoribosylanthranilate isomerase
VCGIRDAASAQAAARADWAGINCVPGRRRAVDIDTARRIIPLLGDCRPVGVFLNQSEDEIAHFADTLNLWGVQIHGETTPAVCARFRRDGRYVIRALAVDEHFAPEQAQAFEPHIDALLVDAREPGSGRRFDPNRIKGLHIDRPLILAGGLTPENVAAAIAVVRPAGVDCASGIEVDGHPDPHRIHTFIQAARRARRAA